jgi:hypothetical protein
VLASRLELRLSERLGVVRPSVVEIDAYKHASVHTTAKVECRPLTLLFSTVPSNLLFCSK